MTAELDVRFGVPRNGWLPFTVAHPEAGEFRAAASNVPTDFVADLVAALLAVLRGDDSSAGASLEPDWWLLEFEREAGGIRVSLSHAEYRPGGRYLRGTRMLSASGTAAEVCRPFVRGLRELERTAVLTGEYESGWNRPFPGERLGEVGRLLREAGR